MTRPAADNSSENLLQAVADLAGRAVPPASTCGVTLSGNGRVVTVASADALARLLVEQQYELDTGPCLEALRTARVVTADDLISENRWEGYPALVVVTGCGRCCPARCWSTGTIGALDRYARTAHAFDGDAHPGGGAADRVGGGHRDRRDAALRRGRADRSPAHRTVLPVGDRPGHRHHHRHATLPPETGFDVLRTVAKNRNAPRRSIAADPVAKTINPERSN